MSPDLALDLVRGAILLAITVGGPVLLLSLTAGLLVGIFQAATQINEFTLTFLPKVAALVLGLLLLGPWLLARLVEYTAGNFDRLPDMVR